MCECGVGDKAVPGEEHSQSTVLIQQGQIICGDNECVNEQEVTAYECTVRIVHLEKYKLAPTHNNNNNKYLMCVVSD